MAVKELFLLLPCRGAKIEPFWARLGSERLALFNLVARHEISPCWHSGYLPLWCSWLADSFRLTIAFHLLLNPMKSWYDILEVHESASAEQIRSAYLKMAREYHPDRVPEHRTKLRADAEDKFKQVQEAWTVLGDPAKRRRYDLAGRRQDVPISPSQPPSQPTQGPAAREGIRDLLHRRQDIVKWTLLVLIATLVLVVAGELVVSRQSASPVTTTAELAKPATKAAANSESKASPRHVQTWRGEGGKGLDVHLISVVFPTRRTGSHVSGADWLP